MQINDRYKSKPLTKEVQSLRISGDGSRKEITREVLREHKTEVFLNGAAFMRITCTGEKLPELVLGRLLSEGIVRRGEEVSELLITEKGNAYVTLPGASLKGPGEIQETTSYGTLHRTGAFPEKEPLKKLPTLAWQQEWIWKLEEAFEAELPLHTRTSSAHAAFLMTEGRVIFGCEDIGRHNALDKAIGFGIREGIPGESSVLFTSGRVPIDMAEKVIRGGIPMLVSRKTPTAEALEMARTYGLCLVGNVKNHSLQLYHEPAAGE